MKKIVLSLVTACALSTAFAQVNTTSLNQNGSSNNSNTFQYGGNQHATIVQNGSSNVNTNEQKSTYLQYTDVNQQGNYNTADTKQNNNAGPSNYINVNQTGNGDGTMAQRNFATVDQSAFWTISSKANVNQNGHAMNATIRQIGARNDVATIDQAGVSGAGANQTASISQGNADVNNSSSNSTAYIEQRSLFSQSAAISQLGNQNTARSYQDDNAGPGNTSTIDQNGNNNIAQINQSDFQTVSTEGKITQTGDRNTAYLDQLGSTSNFTSGSYARITQTGNDNQTRFHQDGGLDNHATISQSGNFNVVEGLGGAGSYALQNGGGNNTLTVMQASGNGSAGQTAMVSQVGTGNVGTISQTTYPMP